MAIVVIGATICRICGDVIDEGQPLQTFPHFIPNEADPLWFFSDGAFHSQCVVRHPLGRQIMTRLAEHQDAFKANYRMCHICHTLIEQPDDYFVLCHFASNQAHPLFPFNYLQFHRNCLSSWPQLPFLHDRVEDLKHNEGWKGRGIDSLLADLEKISLVSG